MAAHHGTTLNLASVPESPFRSAVAGIGVPDERLGEEIKAFVGRKSVQRLTEPDRVAWCRAPCAADRHARLVGCRDLLSVSPTGKVLKPAPGRSHS